MPIVASQTSSLRLRPHGGDLGPVPDDDDDSSLPSNAPSGGVLESFKSCRSVESNHDEMLSKWADATNWGISMTEMAVARHDTPAKFTKKTSHGSSSSGSWLPHRRRHHKEDMEIEETKDAVAMQVDNADPGCSMSVDCEFHGGLLKGQIVIEGMNVPYLFQVAASWEMDMAPLWFPMLESVDKIADFHVNDASAALPTTPINRDKEMGCFSDSPCSCPTSSSTRASSGDESSLLLSHAAPSHPVILDEMMTHLFAVPPVPAIKGVDSYSHRTLYSWSPKCSPTPGSLMIDYSPPLDAKTWKGVKLDAPGRRVFRTEQKATAVYVRPSLKDPERRSDVFVSVLADPGVPTWLVPNSLVKWILRLGARGFVDKVMSVMSGCTTDPTHRYAVRIAERYEELYWKYAFYGFNPPEAAVPRRIREEVFLQRQLKRSELRGKVSQKTACTPEQTAAIRDQPKTAASRSKPPVHPAGRQKELHHPEGSIELRSRKDTAQNSSRDTTELRHFLKAVIAIIVVVFVASSVASLPFLRK
ncbi:hypothetical protein FOZ60_009972 [Perkinsus olseni]|uniref:Uncharacterized protein n=3 Tax=Perkinsus olseni TaxID=32597 RepID=A0A7J6PCA5_PEROL|nr:hypothetical protein FOZ60_009972 [Perkinsus olseni]